MRTSDRPCNRAAGAIARLAGLIWDTGTVAGVPTTAGGAVPGAGEDWRLKRGIRGFRRADQEAIKDQV